jgi:hypothetical protein
MSDHTATAQEASITPDQPKSYLDLANDMAYDACMIAETAVAASIVVTAADESIDCHLPRTESFLKTVQFQLENIKRQAMALAALLDDHQYDYVLKASNPAEAQHIAGKEKSHV